MKYEVHKTQIRLDREVLNQVAATAKTAYDAIGHRDSTEGRSAFSVWNNINKFSQRLFPNEEILDVTGTADDEATMRVYYKPSITSLAKPFRKAIIPTKEGNEFMFFDIKSAEFIMTAIFAGEEKVVNAYKAGLDPYDELAYLFPKGTPRKHYKTTLIASLFGGTPYTTAKRLLISETQAERLHEFAENALPKIQDHKNTIKYTAYRSGHYHYPLNLEKTEYGTMPYKALKDKTIGFNPNLSLSVFTQSALGYWMQQLIKKVETKGVEGTLLTVFDSMLIEIKPGTRNEWIEFINKEIAPFRADISFGKSFYEAAYQE